MKNYKSMSTEKLAAMMRDCKERARDIRDAWGCISDAERSERAAQEKEARAIGRILAARRKAGKAISLGQPKPENNLDAVMRDLKNQGTQKATAVLEIIEYTIENSSYIAAVDYCPEEVLKEVIAAIEDMGPEGAFAASELRGNGLTSTPPKLKELAANSAGHIILGKIELTTMVPPCPGRRPTAQEIKVSAGRAVPWLWMNEDENKARDSYVEEGKPGVILVDNYNNGGPAVFIPEVMQHSNELLAALRGLMEYVGGWDAKPGHPCATAAALLKKLEGAK